MICTNTAHFPTVRTYLNPGALGFTKSPVLFCLILLVEPLGQMQSVPLKLQIIEMHQLKMLLKNTNASTSFKEKSFPLKSSMDEYEKYLLSELKIKVLTMQITNKKHKSDVKIQIASNKNSQIFNCIVVISFNSFNYYRLK